MIEDPTTLTNKANTVLADCETFLEAAAESVRTLSGERKEALERRDAAKEQHERAWENFRRVHTKRPGKGRGSTAEEELERARVELREATGVLASDYLDTEYRKAVARQIAGLLREDSLQELDEIAARSDDPELQRTVDECKEGVNRATRYVINMFPGRDFSLDEVRKARTEAREILDRLKNPPID